MEAGDGGRRGKTAVRSAREGSNAPRAPARAAITMVAATCWWNRRDRPRSAALGDTSSVPLIKRWSLLAVVAGGFVMSSCGGQDGSPDLQSAKDFQGFSLYFVGSSFHGLALTAVLSTPGRGGRVRSWSFIYGDCDPGGGFFDDGGCAPPLEVQNWSICERYPALYGKDRPRLRAFRGARLANSPTEIYTGHTTVVVFGERRAGVLRALRRVGQRAAGQRLPPPAPGTLKGGLPCQHPPSP